MDSSGENDESAERKQKDYEGLISAGTSLIGVVIASMYFDRCPAIPSLIPFLYVFGAVGTLKGVGQFAWQVPSDPKKQDQQAVTTHIISFLGITQIIVAVWGAAITFGEPERLSGEKDDCDSTVFACAFISALIPLVIFTGIVGFLLAKPCREQQANEEEPKPEV